MGLSIDLGAGNNLPVPPLQPASALGAAPQSKAQSSSEQSIADSIGSVSTGGTQDGVSVTYDPVDRELDFVNTDKGSVAVALHEATNDVHQIADVSGLQHELDLAPFESSGAVAGFPISIASSTQVAIGAGTAVFVDFTNPAAPVQSDLNYAGGTVTITNIGSQLLTYLGLTSAGVIVQQATRFTPVQRRSIVPLGTAAHPNMVSVTSVASTLASLHATGSQLHDTLEALGTLNTAGNEYGPNGANLSLNRSAGNLFKFGANTDYDDPHNLPIAGMAAGSFFYHTSTAAITGPFTTVNVTQYESAPGVLSTLGNNRFSVQRIFLFQTGVTRIQFGQHEYQTMDDAIAGINSESYTTEPTSAAVGILRAFMVVKKGATDLSDPAQARFFAVGKFGAVSSGGAALTSANIVTALGYTPANKGGDTFTGAVITPASAAGGAGLRLPHGAAPSAPVDGAVWTTTLGLYARINGATVGPYTAGTSAVTSFNTRTGAVVLTSADVTGALTYTPASKAGDTFTGPILEASGSAALPSYSFSGDADTGMYRPGANSLGFSVGGSDILTMVSGVITTSGRFSVVGGSAESIRIAHDTGYISFYDTAETVRKGFLQATAAYLLLSAENGNRVRLRAGTPEFNLWPSSNATLTTSLDITGALSTTGTAVVGSTLSVAGATTQLSGYQNLYPFSASYDDGGYCRWFWDGNNGELKFSRAGGGSGASGCTLSATGFKATGNSTLNTLSIAEGAVISGTYTPTLTDGANVAASTSNSNTTYMRIGSIVSVAGSFSLDPTAANTVTTLRISLPIASNFGSATQLAGTASRALSSVTPLSSYISGDTTNDVAVLSFQNDGDTSSRTWYFQFQYLVI